MIDAFQFKKYIDYYVYKNRHLPFQSLYAKRMAPVEHMFGFHKWCNIDWYFDEELDEIQDIVIWSQNDNKMTENG